MYLLDMSGSDPKRIKVHFDNETVVKRQERKERKKERLFQFSLLFLSAVLASVLTVIIEHFFTK